MNWETKNKTMEEIRIEVEVSHTCSIGAYLNINRQNNSSPMWRPINLGVYPRGTEQEASEQCCCGWVGGVSTPGFFDQ